MKRERWRDHSNDGDEAQREGGTTATTTTTTADVLEHSRVDAPLPERVGQHVRGRYLKEQQII